MRRRAVLSSRDISGVISGNLAGPAPQRRVAVRAGRKVGRVDVVEGHVQQPRLPRRGPPPEECARSLDVPASQPVEVGGLLEDAQLARGPRAYGVKRAAIGRISFL